MKLSVSANNIFPNIRDIRSYLKKVIIVKYGSQLEIDKVDHNLNPELFLVKLKDIVFNLSVDLVKLNAFVKIRLQVIFNYFEVITRGTYSREHIGPLFSRLESKFAEITKVFAVTNEDHLIGINRPLTIINLNDVNVEMKKIIPLVI